ncbi:hypothetical protein [Paenibacillus ferrarius]|uniref:hypothetical protein n=1 Tax=Paenibacillus ferrarius TaxID=1469647 RepID=UPI003D2679AE
MADAYEQQLTANAQREQEGVDALLGIAEVYELVLSQQDLITQLQARIAQLEGGTA